MLRYALVWIAVTAAAVAGMAAVLHAPGSEPRRLQVAIERAACRLEPTDRAAWASFGAALDAGKVVVRYRAALSAAEERRVRRLARRLAGRALTVPGVERLAATVEATEDSRRLGCPRLDQRTEDAIMLFVQSADDAP